MALMVLLHNLRDPLAIRWLFIHVVTWQQITPHKFQTHQKELTNISEYHQKKLCWFLEYVLPLDHEKLQYDNNSLLI